MSVFSSDTYSKLESSAVDGETRRSDRTYKWVLRFMIGQQIPDSVGQRETTS